MSKRPADEENSTLEDMVDVLNDIAGERLRILSLHRRLVHALCIKHQREKKLETKEDMGDMIGKILAKVCEIDEELTYEYVMQSEGDTRVTKIAFSDFGRIDGFSDIFEQAQDKWSVYCVNLPEDDMYDLNYVVSDQE